MRRGARAPFVVTAAVAASAVVACSQDQTTGNPPCLGAKTCFDDSGLPDTTPFDSPAVTDANVSEVDANPPDCPTNDPGIGARQTCTAPLSVQCTYPDLCPSHPGPSATNDYVCKDDGTGAHWTLVSPEYTPVCPKLQPADGDPCPCTIHMGFAACNYGACEDMTKIYAACKGVDTFDPVWHVKSIACNPPEPDAGFIDVTDDAGDASDTMGE